MLTKNLYMVDRGTSPLCLGLSCKDRGSLEKLAVITALVAAIPLSPFLCKYLKFLLYRFLVKGNRWRSCVQQAGLMLPLL